MQQPRLLTSDSGTIHWVLYVRDHLRLRYDFKPLSDACSLVLETTLEHISHVWYAFKFVAEPQGATPLGV